MAVNASNVTLTDCETVRALGGQGGSGGAGGQGQPGGAGGPIGVHFGTSPPGAGGKGAHGGHGGGGGGGAGGHSSAIIRTASCTVSTSGLVVSGGSAGAGGNGGISAPAAVGADDDGNDGAGGQDGLLDVELVVPGPEPAIAVHHAPNSSNKPFPACNIGCFTVDVPEPSSYRLGFAGVTPNPIATESALRFTLPIDARVTIELFDVGGRQVGEVFDRTFGAGHHVIDWRTATGGMNARAAGLYFIRFETLGRVFVRRAIVLQ